MTGPRYEFLELEYGRHSGRVEFEDRDGPFLILGSNGAGKSTVIEALVRTLYGFRRTSPAERLARERRRPWVGGAYRSVVGLSGPEGSLTFARDFETDEVIVRQAGRDEPLFSGEPKLSRGGETTKQYRDLLRRHVGLSSLNAYLRTGCVQQGGLVQTGLSEDLLRVVAGGHADVQTAQERLNQEYHELTAEPIDEGERRRQKPGRIERLQAHVSELEARARDARLAEQRRAPLAEERDRLQQGSADLQAEIEGLEAAFEGLSEREGLTGAVDVSQGRVRLLEEAGHELDEAMARLDLQQHHDPGDGLVYPTDFLARLGALQEGLWPRMRHLDGIRQNLEEELRALPPHTAGANLRALGPAGVAVAGLWLLTQTQMFAGIALLIVGLISGTAILVQARLRGAERRRVSDAMDSAESERRDVEARIASLLDEVPESETLTADTITLRRREFERQVVEREARAEAELALRRAMDRARRALAAESESAESESADSGDPQTGQGEFDGIHPGSEGALLERARTLLRDLQGAVSDERDDRLAPLKLQLLEASRRSFGLPDDVEPTAGAVRSALKERRAAHRKCREDVAGLERRLAYEGRPEQSALALDHEIQQVRDRLEPLVRRIEAYQQGHALVAEAYEAFRATDQDRLLRAISDHLERMSNGELGPIEVTDGLETARVRAGTRALPLASPPLSYGQWHVVLLAIRLGAADFLAGLGVRLPLLLDDPFVHLDASRARELWEVLERVSAERQVFVATQDSLLVDHLGIEPHLDLDVSPLGEPDGGAPHQKDPSMSSVNDPPAPVEDAVASKAHITPSEDASSASPDLWSFLPEDG